MQNLISYPAEILLLIFLIVVFLQSSIDKVFDWRGNLSFLKSHFSDTPLESLTPLLLGTVLFSEMVAGLLCSGGLFQIVVFNEFNIAFYGAIVACLSLLMLLFGQRMAKDYEGAQTIAVYFVPAVFLVFLLQG